MSQPASVSQASVLVVEDNDLERQITVDTLREEGFKVEAGGARQARDGIAEPQPLRRGPDRSDDARDVGRGTAGAGSPTIPPPRWSC